MSVIFLDNETVWYKLWPQHKYRSTWPLFRGLVIKIIWWVNIIQCSWYIESVWHTDWSHQVFDGQWPIFYGPVILLHILKTVWLRNVVFGIMDQCDTKIDLLKYMWVSDLYFMVHWFCLFIIVIDLNYLFTLTNGTGQGYLCPSRHLLLCLSCWETAGHSEIMWTWSL